MFYQNIRTYSAGQIMRLANNKSHFKDNIRYKKDIKLI